MLANSSCSATKRSVYHLKRAIALNPDLKVPKPIKEIQIQRGVRSEVPIEPILANMYMMTFETNEGIKVKPEIKEAVKYLTIECPPDSLITVTETKYKVVKEELTDKELFKEAKERLSEWQTARLASGMLVSCFLLGFLSFFLIRLYFTLRG